MNLFDELKRRNVFRVAIFYVVASWLIIQVAETVLPLFEVPDAILRGVVILLAIGFLPALAMSWIYELTPEGIKRETDVDRNASVTPETGRKLNIATLVVAGLAIGLMAYDRLSTDEVKGSGSFSSSNALENEPDPFTQATSIAVLPFVNMSDSREQEYFSDGMTEEIINALVKIPDLAVAARTSVFAFKDRTEDVRAIGEKLGVNHILEGSVRSAGDDIRITAQLIRVDNGFHLWSETFDRQLVNVFEIQEEIATAIAEQLAINLGESIDSVPNRTKDLAAYDLYLKGRAQLRDRALDNAVSTLNRSVELDPEFAPAWAALAIALQVKAQRELKGLDDAVVAAESALELDPDNVDALTALASVHRDRENWREADELFEQAMAIDPRASELLEDYAEFLGATAQLGPMLEISQRGYAMDPLLGPLFDVHLSALILNGRTQEALTLATSSELDSWWISERLVQIHLLQGNTGLAILELRRLSDYVSELQAEGLSEPGLGNFEAYIQRALELLRNPDDQTLIRESLKRFRSSSFWNLLDWLILTAVGADETDLLEAVIERIKRGRDLHEWYWMPEFTRMRQLPLFAELLELRNLPAYWDEVGWPDFCARTDSGDIRCH